jgi:hypothetical protein
MATEHKAFVFDYITFIQELANILEMAIFSQNSRELIFFIENNLQYLKDPDSGEFLDLEWQEMIETKDVNECGDFALTKYYDPHQNVGLGYNWELLYDALQNELKTEISPLLGLPFGYDNNYFDPGKIGSYFQFPEQVKENLERINSLSPYKKQNFPNIVVLEEMLSTALALEKGLYITF